MGGSRMSPSRYSRFLKPCFFARSEPNSTIFCELSTAMICLDFPPPATAPAFSRPRQDRPPKSAKKQRDQHSRASACQDRPERNRGRNGPLIRRNIRAPYPRVCAKPGPKRFGRAAFLGQIFAEGANDVANPAPGAVLRVPAWPSRGRHSCWSGDRPPVRPQASAGPGGRNARLAHAEDGNRSLVRRRRG